MRYLLAICLVALVAAGCAGTRGDIVGEFGGPSLPSTATTQPPTSTTLTLPVPTLEEEVAAIVESVASYRELNADRVSWRLVDPQEVGRRAFRPTEPGENVATGYPERFLTMLGVAGDTGVAVTPAASYDPARKTVYVADTDQLTPLGKVEIFEAFATAATDARYDWYAEMAERDAAGAVDSAWALWGLVAGDARFASEVYVENEFDATEAFALQFERIEREKAREGVPGYIVAKSEFPTVAGRAFVEDLVSSGGIGFVNAAYRNPPTTTEQVFHPSRYFGGEEAIEVSLPDIALRGYEVVEEGALGERGFQALFRDGVSNSRRLQAATGWGGDGYRVWWNGEDTVMLVIIEGDTARDAGEFNETIGGWALNQLPVGSGLADHRGLAFAGPEAYAFTATDAAEVLMVVATDTDAGKYVRDFFWPRF